jgi:hypothetical protein
MKCFLILSAIAAVALAAPVDNEFDMASDYHHNNANNNWNRPQVQPTRPEWNRPSNNQNELEIPEWINGLWNQQNRPNRPETIFPMPEVAPWIPSRPNNKPNRPNRPNQPWPIAPLPENVERPQNRPEWVPIRIVQELFQQWMQNRPQWSNNGNQIVRPQPIQPIRPIQPVQPIQPIRPLDAFVADPAVVA